MNGKSIMFVHAGYRPIAAVVTKDDEDGFNINAHVDGELLYLGMDVMRPEIDEMKRRIEAQGMVLFTYVPSPMELRA